MYMDKDTQKILFDRTLKCGFMSHHLPERWTAALWHHLEINYPYFCEAGGIIYLPPVTFLHIQSQL